MATTFARYLFSARGYGVGADLGLLIGRVVFGGLMATHGWQKLSDFSGTLAKFGDPIGLGPRPSLVMLIFAEFFCAILIALGLMTRLAAIPLAFAMSVAAFVAHRGQPLGAKEMALLYLAAWLLILLAGPGRFSLDHLIGGRPATKSV